MTGSILSRKFKRKTKEWEQVDLDNEDEERRRAVAGNAKNQNMTHTPKHHQELHQICM